MTSAPSHARSWVHEVPASNWVRSSTRMPFRALLMARLIRARAGIEQRPRVQLPWRGQSGGPRSQPHEEESNEEEGHEGEGDEARQEEDPAAVGSFPEGSPGRDRH